MATFHNTWLISAIQSLISLIHQARTSGRTSMLAEHIWLTGFLCSWTIGVELLARGSKKASCWLYAFTADVFIYDMLMHSAQ